MAHKYRSILAPFTLQHTHKHSCKLWTLLIGTSLKSGSGRLFWLFGFQICGQQMGTSLKSSLFPASPHLMGKITCVRPHFTWFANTPLYTNTLIQRWVENKPILQIIHPCSHPCSHGFHSSMHPWTYPYMNGCVPSINGWPHPFMDKCHPLR